MATFVLPKGMHMQISTLAQAGYTQAAYFQISSLDLQPRILLQHRSQNYWDRSDFQLPVNPYAQDTLVKIWATYLYTDSDWGGSEERIWSSTDTHILLGYDDSRHERHDNDFDDYMIDITFVSGPPRRISAEEFSADVKAYRAGKVL